MLSNLHFLIIAGPAAYLLAALAARLQPGLRPAFTKKASLFAAFFNLLPAGLAIYLTISQGVLHTNFWNYNQLGISIRIDPLSTLMFSMIAILALVIVKYSLNYLDGDDRQGVFLGRLSSTIAAVQVMVIAGNIGLLLLAWMATSVTLHRLLLFYPNRRRAVNAARKKFIFARLGDIAFIIASVILYRHFSTGELQYIFDKLKSDYLVNGLPANLELSAILLLIAAVLKSAQFPTHGWLVEVMETPTPVSALLHAGLLNAGPFLVVRLAFLFEASTAAPVVLIVVGGITSIVAGLSMVTQPGIKTMLAYSSVAHMGFMLLICGIGVYPAAMLHLVAHSFYKAHAFLSSGTIVNTLHQGRRMQLPSRIGNVMRITLSIVLAILIYWGFAWLWNIDPVEEFALLVTGFIIVMGLTQMIAPLIDAKELRLNGLLKVTGLAALVSLSFFSLEAGAHKLLHSQIPGLSQPNNSTIVLMLAMLLAYGVIILFQIAEPALPARIWRLRLALFFRNGLYINALLDRLLNAHTLKKNVAEYSDQKATDGYFQKQPFKNLRMANRAFSKS